MVVSPEGTFLGQGFSQRASDPHAEVMALRYAANKGHDGRCDRLCDLAAVFSSRQNQHVLRCTHRSPHRQVVGSINDANPLVAGQGFARLRAAGIEVEIGPRAKESRELNMGTSVK